MHNKNITIIIIIIRTVETVTRRRRRTRNVFSQVRPTDFAETPANTHPSSPRTSFSPSRASGPLVTGVSPGHALSIVRAARVVKKKYAGRPGTSRPNGQVRRRRRRGASKGAFALRFGNETVGNALPTS